MIKDIEVIKVNLNNAESLRNLRLQLVKENPKTYGVLYSTEKRKSIEHFRKLIREHNAPDSGIFLLRKVDKFIGMGNVSRNNPKDSKVGYLGSLGIIKEYHGQGLGEYLLKYRLEWIKNNTKFEKVDMIIQKANKKMLSLAKKHGFKIIGEGSYYHTPEYYMEKNII